MILKQYRHFKRIFSHERFRSLLKGSWSMGWPLILVMLFEFLISITDVYIAGKFGKEVQGAVGFTAQVYYIFVVLANAITVGTVSIVSKAYGGKNSGEFITSVFTVIVSVIASGIVFTAAGFFVGPLAVSASSVPDEIKNIAVEFLKLYFAGLLFHYFLINSNGLLRATKQARRSLVTMGIVTVLNIGLNYTFLYSTNLGFRGIALATVVSYFAGALLNICPVLKLVRGCALCYSSAVMKKIAHISWPTLIMQISWQLGAVVMFLILSDLPENRVETIAAFTNGLRIESAIFLPAYALNMAAAAIIGNLIGEGKNKDAYQSGIITALMGMGIIIVLSALVIVNAGRLSGFLSDNPLVVNESMRYLIIQMIAEPFMAVLVVLSGALNGAGDTRGVMIIISGSLWLVRIPLSYVLAIKLGLGPAAVWWSMNIDIFVRMVLTIIRYRRRRWLGNIQ